MPDQYKFTPAMQSLISDMLRMLIAYEVELTAYRIVLDGAQEKFIRNQIPWDMMSNVRKILKTPAAHAEAEAIYAPFSALLQQLTPQNLEIALASIRRRIAEHNANVPPDIE
jgi:hypothetical protein